MRALAPPSGSDLAGYASAAYTRTKSQALSEALSRLRDPSLTAEQRDLAGATAQLWSPNQGFAARDMEDATKRYGYDLNSRTELQKQTLANEATRYGHERVFAASRANNADDNRRALATNEADNRRFIDAAMLDPVAAGATRFVPPPFQSQYGVPGLQVGTLSAGAGQTVVAPDGRTVAGAPTDEQVKAAAFRDVQAKGLITPQDTVDLIMGKERPVEAVGPEGKAVFMTPGAATRTGAQVAYKPSSESVQNYQTPDGKTGTAVFDDTRGGLVDTQTKAPVPAGSKVFRTSVQGSAAETGVKTTEAQDTKALAANVMQPAAERLFKAFDEGRLPSTGDYIGFQAGNKLPSFAAPAIVSNMSPQGQMFYQDLKTILPQQLLVMSGQGVTDAEYERTLARLVPVPGEDPAVSAAKRQQISQFYEGVRALAGPAMDKVDAAAAKKSEAAAAPPRRMKFNPETGRVE